MGFVECEKDEFMCPISKKCIKRLMLCNGDNDCPNGTDEKYNCGKLSFVEKLTDFFSIVLIV